MRNRYLYAEIWVAFWDTVWDTSVRGPLGVDAVTAPHGVDAPRWVSNDSRRRAVRSEIITIGLDLAKNVFQAHGADGAGRAVLRKKPRRDQVLAFFGALPPCMVALEPAAARITGDGRSPGWATRCV